MWNRMPCRLLTCSVRQVFGISKMLPWNVGVTRFILLAKVKRARILCTYPLNCRSLWLIPWFCHDVWPDHSVLVGRFRNLTNAPPLWVWPSPHEFPWPADFGHNVQWNPRAADMTTGYQTLWHAIEQDAAQCVPFPVDAAAFGRAQRLTPKKVKPFLTVPIKLARQGEFQPEYHGPSLRHAQMVRQVGRLQSYSRLAASRKPDLAILAC